MDSVITGQVSLIDSEDFETPSEMQQHVEPRLFGGIEHLQTRKTDAKSVTFTQISKKSNATHSYAAAADDDE